MSNGLSNEKPSRLRVARVITRLNVGGPTRHVGMLAEGLPGLGYAQDLIAGYSASEEGEGVLPVPEPIHRLPHLVRPVNPWKDWRSYQALRRHFAETQPHIVHTHQAKAGILGRWAAWRTEVPVRVHTYHGHTFEAYWRGLTARGFLAAERALARRSTHLICQSRSQEIDVLQALGEAAEGRTVIVPPALPAELLRDFREACDAAERPAAEIILGFPARLVAVKRPDHMLRWVQALRAECSVHLVVAGDGPLKAQLEGLAKSLGIAEHITWLGQVRDMRRFYRQVDVVALTSAMEGTPLALLEAMAAGRPVVSTAVGGVGDILQGQGLLLPPSEDPVAWAERFHAWWGDAAARTRLVAAAQARVRQEQAPERLLADLDRLYRKALRGVGLG